MSEEADVLAEQLYNQCWRVPKKFKEEFRYLSDNAKRKWRGRAREMLKGLP